MHQLTCAATSVAHRSNGFSRTVLHSMLHSCVRKNNAMPAKAQHQQPQQWCRGASYVMFNLQNSLTMTLAVPLAIWS